MRCITFSISFCFDIQYVNNVNGRYNKARMGPYATSFTSSKLKLCIPFYIFKCVKLRIHDGIHKYLINKLVKKYYFDFIFFGNLPWVPL